MNSVQQITYKNKVERRTNDTAEEYKITAADMNEIKKVVNSIVSKLSFAKIPKSINITSADFEGNIYINQELIGKTPYVDFNLWNNDGTGILLKNVDDYTHNSQTGAITISSGEYLLMYYKNLL